LQLLDQHLGAGLRQHFGRDAGEILGAGPPVGVGVCALQGANQRAELLELRLGGGYGVGRPCGRLGGRGVVAGERDNLPQRRA
jgi:hypothetical protein